MMLQQQVTNTASPSTDNANMFYLQSVYQTTQETVDMTSATSLASMAAEVQCQTQEHLGHTPHQQTFSTVSNLLTKPQVCKYHPVPRFHFSHIIFGVNIVAFIEVGGT